MRVIVGGSSLKSDGFGLTISDNGGVAIIGACGVMEFYPSRGIGNAFKEGTANTPNPRRL